MVDRNSAFSITIDPLTILTLFIILWITNGFFSPVYYYIPILIKVAVYFFWLLLACTRDRHFIRRLLKEEIFLLILIANLSVAWVFTNAQVSYYVKTTFFFMVFYSLFLFYKDKKRKKNSRIIIYCVLLDYAYVAINTMIKLQNEPNLSRFLTHDDGFIIENFGIKASLGVGNYTYAYSIVIVLFLLIYCIKYKIHTSISILGLALFTAVMIKMEFAIAIILFLCIGVVSIFIRYSKDQSSIRSRSMITLIIAGTILIVSLPLWMRSLPFSIQEKFEAVLDFLIDGRTSYFIDQRMIVYRESIDTIVSSPFLGSMINGNVGNHATWIDFYATLGILSWPLYFFVMKLCKEIASYSAEIGNIIGIYWMALGSINIAYSPRFLMTLCIVGGLFASLVTDRYKKDEEKESAYNTALRGRRRFGSRAFNNY